VPSIAAILGNKLEGSNAIPADLGQVPVSVGSRRADFLRDAPSQVVRVRQQVFSNGHHGSAPICFFPQNGKGWCPFQLAWGIAEFNGSPRLLEECAHQPVFEGFRIKKESRLWESNPRQAVYKTATLPLS
jgi:hypothetical protein